MRILHVTPSFYPAWAYGGIPRCAYELSRALTARGEEVTVWTTDVLDAGQRIGEGARVIDGIYVRYFPNLSNRLAYHAQLYLPRGLLRFAWRYLPAFDLVHVHSHRHLLEIIVTFIALRARLPLVYTGNGTIPAIERWVGLKRVLDAAGAAYPLRRASACIAVSQAEVSHYVEAGVPGDRITVIPNGIRPEEYRPLPAPGRFRERYGFGDAPLVVFVGKITPRKGLDVLLRSLARMPAQVRLAVVGNFMMPEAQIRRLVERLGLGSRVTFTGLLLGEDKLAAYADAAVVAYPSTDEIFGLVPAESLMCGTPVVVCEDSGCGEVVSAAGGGLLVPYGDEAALAAALQRLLDSPLPRAELAERGRAYVERQFAWDDIAGRTLALYRRLVGAKG